MPIGSPAAPDGLRSEPLDRCAIFLLLLLAADAAFVLVHVVHGFTRGPGSSLYSLQRERGYAEIFQYVKLSWIIILLSGLWWRTRDGVYVAWTLLYVYLLCDDALQNHERAGLAIAKRWGYVGTYGLRPRDLGELTVCGLLGLVFMTAIWLIHLRSACDAKSASAELALLTGVLVVFGVGVDTLHAMLAGEAGEMALAVLEEGGELLAVSLICWYVLNLLAGCRHALPSPWRRTR